MHATDVTSALLRLCRDHPEFRWKLAAEIGSSRIAAVDREYMVWQSLHKIMDLAPRILEMARADLDELEDWQEYKVNLAAEYLDAVHDSLKYRPEDLKIEGVEIVTDDGIVPAGR
jgi:hypothetical protein